jgi:glycosyltransferase involved in cell wall biosynthesis
MRSSPQMPLVSVALCTYNGSQFLAEQLTSVIEQTYRNVEIIIVDDCSTDESVEISKRFAARDSRIRVVRNSKNLGFKANFEFAMTLCSGDFIAPCDQDDIWEPEKIARLVEVIGQRGLSYCDSALVDAQGTPTGVRMSSIVHMATTDDPVPFAFGNCVSGHAMLFRRELLQLALPIPEEFFHDWWIAAVAAARGGIAFHRESLVLYRQHGSNVTDVRLKEMMADAGLSVARIQSPASRPRGAGLRYFRETERRLASISRLPGIHQAFAAQLHAAWRRREHQWFSPGLAHLMIKHRRRLLRFTNFSEKKARRYSRDLFCGLRIKRLTDSRAFTSC